MWNLQAGVQNWKKFCLKINIFTQKKLLDFENWCNGEVSESVKILLFKWIFNVKNHRNLLIFILFIEECQFRSIFLSLIFFDNMIFKSLYAQIFDNSPLNQFSKFNNFLWVCWFLGEKLSNFVPPAQKLDNPYYHNTDTHEKHQDVKTDKLAETNPMLMVSDFDANFCKVEKAKTITGPEDSITSSTSNYSTKTDSISSLEKSEDDGNETPTPSPRNSLSSLLSLDVSVLIYIF